MNYVLRSTLVTVGLVVGPIMFRGGAIAAAQTPSAKFVDSARVEIERGVRDMDVKRLEDVQLLLDRALVAFPDDPYLLHYRGYLAYRQVTGMMMTGDKTRVGPIIARGLADLSKSAEKLRWPETLALEARLNSMRIPLEPGSGMTLGPLTGRLSADASRLGPNNPRVALLQAYIAEQTPETMGGGVERARALVAKALSMFDGDRPEPLAPAWGKEEAGILQQRLTKPGGG
jgi:hypothetical protein